ncbi:MAG: hypothetical protein LDL41_06445 [Coleofasciculus sp. S288]|nr:hypothetical protein [Coleofasciculus sp. S288]
MKTENQLQELYSLLKQTAQVFLGFVVILLLTGGLPSQLVLGLSFLLGVIFIGVSEKDG